MKRIAGILLLTVCCVTVLAAEKIDVYSRPRQSERSRAYDALHYRVKINLDIAGKSFRGESTMTLSPFKDGFETCVLDAEDFTVTSVTGNWGKPLTFEQSGKKLTVHMPRPYKYGEILSFTVFYHGKEPKAGLRFYEKSPDHPALVASDSWPDGVHHWFPCFDYPNDKVTNEIIATVKTGFKVVANGHLAGIREDKSRGTVTYHWSQERPHSTYLIFLAAAPYVVVRDMYGSIPINYWVYPQHEPHARVSFRNTTKMMEYFNRIFGYDYPWVKYDQVVVPFGGGQESTSSTAMGQWLIHDERGEQDFSNTGIVAHELAHQWWGNLVTLRTWDHAWVNESFGTYCDYLYYNHERGPDEGAVNLLNKKNRYLHEARTRYMRPIVMDRYNKPQDLFDSHSYPKGAAVLHMLRFILGDDAFFRTLKHFLHTHAFEAVDSHDFIKAVKTVTGQNLDWFFRQWLFSPGHPVLDISWTWDKTSKKVILRVTQTQDTSTRVPLFRMPVRIAITTAKGKKIHTVTLRQQQEAYKFPVPAKPFMVRFDEGNYLLKEWTFPKTKEELMYQLANDDVIGRMWAAGRLERFKQNPAVLNSLVKSAKQDTFWAVRRDAVHTLAKIDAGRFIPLFKQKCLDKNSKVRAAALEVLGNLKRSALAGFLKTRFNRDNSYLVQAAALDALGKCGDRAVIPFLEKAEHMPSPRNVIGKAARRALKELR
jgi:aminopeptidase N